MADRAIVRAYTDEVINGFAQTKSLLQESVTTEAIVKGRTADFACLLYTSPSPRDRQKSRMPSSA